MSNDDTPGPPTPEELRHLEEMIRELGPGMTSEAIDTITGIQAEWYWAWQKHGIPEQRAAEWTEVMVESMFRAGP